MKYFQVHFLLFALCVFTNCKKESLEPIETGNDPNFKIVANKDGVLNSFNRKVVVFINY